MFKTEKLFTTRNLTKTYEMKKLLALLTMTLVFFGVNGQTGQYTKADESDPAAKAILDQVRKKYDSYKTMEASFSLDIEFPDQPVEVQKGSIARQGDKYKLDIASQTIISDGQALYLILHQNKEVQINSMPDEEDMQSMLSPESLLSFYDKGDFTYVLVNEFMDKGRAVQQIEFKPLDRNAEYSKIRMTVDKRTKDVIYVKSFSKDGSRYTFKLDKITPDKSFPAGFFTFDKAKFPGYHVEDLRE
jgi:outer membrane lipoprotein carrier protein